MTQIRTPKDGRNFPEDFCCGSWDSVANRFWQSCGFRQNKAAPGKPGRDGSAARLSLKPSSAVPVDRLRFALRSRRKYRANSEDYAKENYAKLKTIAGEVAERLNAAVC